MKINRITTEQYDGTVCFDKRINSGLTVISVKNSESVMLAVAKALGYPVKLSEAKAPSEDYCVTIDEDWGYDGCEPAADVLGHGRREHAICGEALACNIFINTDEKEYPKRLKKYKRAIDYYRSDEFDEITDNYGESKVFRRCLFDFVKGYRAIPIDEEKDLYMRIDRDGEFVLCEKKGEEFIYRDINVNEKDKDVFRLLGFFELNEFWTKANELKIYDPEKMPVLVCGISPDPVIKDILRKKAAKLDKQIIMFCEALDT